MVVAVTALIWILEAGAYWTLGQAFGLDGAPQFYLLVVAIGNLGVAVPFSAGPLAPARELLGYMLLDAGRSRDALTTFEATMKKEPNRFRGAYGAARAAEAAGDRGKARRYYSQLLEIAREADANRPELMAARKFVDNR